MEFRGKCKGVSLRQRGPKDDHIAVIIETEDDGNWSGDDEQEYGGFSSYWLPELIEQLQAAHNYCKSQEPDVAKDGNQYGWKFKTAEQKQEDYQRKLYEELKKKFEG